MEWSGGFSINQQRDSFILKKEKTCFRIRQSDSPALFFWVGSSESHLFFSEFFRHPGTYRRGTLTAEFAIEHGAFTVDLPTSILTFIDIPIYIRLSKIN